MTSQISNQHTSQFEIISNEVNFENADNSNLNQTQENIPSRLDSTINFLHIRQIEINQTNFLPDESDHNSSTMTETKRFIEINNLNIPLSFT